MDYRLQRRQYKGRGPNFLWHIDGLDRLKPCGFCIQGGIDGYSKRILWLKVSILNNKPAFKKLSNTCEEFKFRGQETRQILFEFQQTR